MASRTLPFKHFSSRRRFLVLHGAGLAAIFIAFALVNWWVDTRAVLRQETIFNEQQSLQTRMAAHAIQESLRTPFATLDFLTTRAEQSASKNHVDLATIRALLKNPLERFPSLLTLAFLDGETSVAAQSEDKTRGTATELLRHWAKQHWATLSNGRTAPLVPRLHISRSMQALGVLRPVVVDGHFLGIMAAVVDLQHILSIHIAPLKSGKYGAAYVLDDKGTVVYDHELQIIGRNVFDGLHDAHPDLLEIDQRLVNETHGHGAYSFSVRRGGEQARKLIAWNVLKLDKHKLTIAMSAPDTEVNDALRSIRFEHNALSALLLLSLIGISYYSYHKTVHQDIIASHRKLLDIIEFLPDPTFVVDRDGTLIAWNKAIAEMTGVPGEDIIGKGEHAYAVPFYGEPRPGLVALLDSSDRVPMDHYSSVQRSGRILYAETFVPMVHGGRGAHVWATASQLLSRDGSVVGCIESIRDISDRILTERKLRESEERYALSVRGANDGIWDWNLKSDTVYYSPRWKAIIGYDDHEMSNAAEEWTSRIHPQDEARVMEANKTVIAGLAEHFEVEYRLRHKDGTYRWVLGRGAGLRDRHGNVQRMAGAHTDITERKENEIISSIMLGVSSAVSSTRNLCDLYAEVHRILLEHIGADTFYIALVHPEKDIIDFAYARDPHHGLPWKAVSIKALGGTSLTLAVYEQARPMILNRQQQMELNVMGEPAELWLGVPLLIQGAPVGVMAVNDYFDAHRYTKKDIQLLASVSEQVALGIERKRNEEELTRQALHDTLTGQPNRTLFLDRLERAITRSSRHREYHFAVVMMDLDRFKIINDSHGHPAGDKVLRQTAQRIAPALRTSDTLARLGGDEFAILLEDFDKPQQVIHIVRRIQQSIAAPMDVEGTIISTTASMGIVIRTEGYATPDDLLRDADIAMYQAKNQGKGLFRVFNPGMHLAAMSAMALEADLSSALENDELDLVFQPLFRADDHSLMGFETLLRWNRPGRGLTLPDEFIPCAEETGLIIPMGEWVLHKACSTMAEWIQRHPTARELTLAVNISAKQAAHSNFVGVVRRILSETGIAPHRLELELTETAIMEDPEFSLAELNRLKKLGVRLAIDDFGTGYSSLSHLSRFPMDTLKVDRSFVAGMGQTEGNQEIIKAVVGLAHILNLTVVAEGVETQRQFSMVRDMGCSVVQGYHLAHPMDAEQIETLLATQPHPSPA